MKVNWPERIWVNSPVRKLVERIEVRYFKQRRDIAPGGHILEIGCGRGAGAKMVVKTFSPRRMDALDLDEAMIRLALREKWLARLNTLFFVGDAQFLPYPDGCLDAVFNFGIIHHLEDWQAGIREIARVIKPGGAFYFEEIYPPLYANFLFKRLLLHPRRNRFHGPEFRAALADRGLDLLPNYRESRFGILGVAVKRDRPK